MAKTKKENVFKKFFRCTFSRHDGGEYSEFLTRGLRGEEGVNKKYPWAYIRLFALLFILFAIFILIVRFTSNSLFYPTITVLASTCCNLSFIMLLYELYPRRDLSFLAVILAMLLGGAAANIIAQVLFNIFPTSNSWLNAVYSGFFEELPKAAATIAVIIISRKKGALTGFMFGAAVGCGFSIVEDMGYIFVKSDEMPMMNLVTVIEISASRGATAFCTHTLWTAAIGWAYSHFERHLSNFVIYPITLLSCALHIAWDLPVNYVANALICIGCGFVACVECIVIIAYERKKTFSQESAPAEDTAKAEAPAPCANSGMPFNASSPLYWRHWGYVALVLGAFLMAVIAVFYCAVPYRETYGTMRFKSKEDFVYFMQDGLSLSTTARAYDITAKNVSVVEEDGQIVYVTQEVKREGVTYGYVYSASYDEVTKTNYYLPYSAYVKINDGVSEIAYFKEDVYKDGALYCSFYRITKTVVSGYNFESNGDITVFIYDADFVRDLTDYRYMWLFITFAVIFFCCLVCYVSLRIKSWRVKKLCMTTNVSSVK